MSILDPEILLQTILSFLLKSVSNVGSSKRVASLFLTVFLSLPESWFCALTLTAFLNILELVKDYNQH